MRAKHVFTISLVSLTLAKRKSGRRPFKKHQAHLAQKGGVSIAQFYMPGSVELFNSFVNKEVETHGFLKDIDEEYEKEQEIISQTLGDRGFRPGRHHKKTGEPWPISGNLPLPEFLTTIENAGGLPFCKALSKIEPENLPEFVKTNPGFGKGYREGV